MRTLNARWRGIRDNWDTPKKVDEIIRLQDLLKHIDGKVAELKTSMDTAPLIPNDIKHWHTQTGDWRSKLHHLKRLTETKE